MAPAALTPTPQADISVDPDYVVTQLAKGDLDLKAKEDITVLDRINTFQPPDPQGPLDADGDLGLYAGVGEAYGVDQAGPPVEDGGVGVAGAGQGAAGLGGDAARAGAGDAVHQTGLGAEDAGGED